MNEELKFNAAIRRLSNPTWKAPGLPAVAKTVNGNTVSDTAGIVEGLTIVPRAELLAGQVAFGGAA